MTDETADATDSDAEATRVDVDPADTDAAETETEVDADTDGAADADTEADVEAEAGETDRDAADLTARVAEHDEDLAAEVGDLRTRAEALESDLADAEERGEELESRLKRTRAEFQNYKKRAKKREEETRERATEDLVERLVPVRDNLLRALDQDEDADIRDGVESTLDELDRVLGEEGVEPIEPAPGDAVDPQRHEVMMRVDSDRPAETIAEVYRPGYEMADTVLREAQVTVSDGSDE